MDRDRWDHTPSAPRARVLSGRTVTAAAIDRSGLKAALEIAEEMRDEIRDRVGLSGMRLQIFREGSPLTIGLDDDRTEGDAVLMLTIADPDGEIANVLVRDQGRRGYAPEEARTIVEIVRRYTSTLRAWLRQARWP